MKIENTNIEKIKIITPDVFEDSRGYFFESFNSNAYLDEGLPSEFVQDNEVRSKKNVLRGLHYQLDKPQGKLVRVVYGNILDVAVDIRIGSPTFGQYKMVELSAENKKIFFVPEGFAHGYLVTSQESIVLYKCTNIYKAKDEYGIRWDDATIGVEWGNSNPILSERDENLPALKEQKFLPEY
tara:strand:+ start:658 stop:1203 length:546 start_codon:yes stop_codon:yes gene_type:complete